VPDGPLHLFPLTIKMESASEARFPAAASNEQRIAAPQSVVLLEKAAASLPLSKGRTRPIAIISPLADEPCGQLDAWIFGGDPSLSDKVLQGLRDPVGGEIEIDELPYTTFECSNLRLDQPEPRLGQAAAEGVAS
jgi:beta-glucosidase-like glycosyl hydrolase